MDTSPDLWTRIVNDWRGLSEGTRDGIISGLAVALALGVLGVFRNALSRGLNRLFKRDSPQSTTKHEVIIKVDTSQQTAPVQTEPSRVEPPKVEPPALSPEFPRQPAVPFVERSDKAGHSILAQLKDKLAPGNDRLVALWGSGGVGKTRLAIEAVHALKESFANRIVWVSADGRPDFTLSTLLDGIAAQLNRADLRQLAPEPKEEQVCALVAASRALVVLDNFETIAPAERVRCRDFLAQHVSCPALITTRDFIVSDFVDNISVEEMSDEEAQKFLDELVAQAPAHIKFDQPTRARIIKTATAIPLVMQWVFQQIILTQRPQDVLNKLSQGKGSAAERVFDKSFDLPQVGDDGRAALLALALFTPSASRIALADVAGFGSELERLDRAVIPLGSLRLVKTADDGERLTVEGLTRELALAHLSEDSRADEFRQRFIAYFLQYAESHEQPTPEDYDALETERDNLLSATDAAFAREDWRSVVRMTYALALPYRGMLFVRGYWDEAIEHGEQAIKAARATRDDETIAAFAGNVATIRQERGEYDGAKMAHFQAIAAFRELKNEANVAVGLHQLGMLAQEQGDIDEARKLYGESLEIKKRLGDQSGVAISLHNLAAIAQGQGELDEARKLYGESLEIKKRLGDQSGIATTLDGLGLLEKEEGNVAEAGRLLSESLSIFERLGSPNAVVVRRHLEGVKGKA